MSAFTPAAWSDFFVAEAGAAAALTGLVIVAISINLSTLLKNKLLTGRAAETVALLAGVLMLATFALVPGQPLWVFGGALPIAGAGVSLLTGSGGGLYWLVPGVVVSLLGGIVNTWILLVEILR